MVDNGDALEEGGGDEAALFFTSSEEDDESASLLLNGNNGSPRDPYSSQQQQHDDGQEGYHELQSSPGGGAPGKRPVIGLLGVTVLSYFTVSGGPFGLEVALAAGGPANTLCALLVLTAISALPCALMTAELASALPGRGGFSYWVERGISPRMGELVNWISLVNTAVDSSAYPGVAWDYLCFGRRRWAAAARASGSSRVTAAALATALATDATPTSFAARSLAMCVMIGGTCLLNLKGLTLAARAALLLAIFSLLPFAYMTLVACTTPWQSLSAIVRVLSASFGGGGAAGSGSSSASVAAAAVAEAAAGGSYHQDIPLMLAVCLWSVSGFEAVSFVSGEVGQAGTAMPRALVASLLCMFFATGIPIVMSCIELDTNFEHTRRPWEGWALGSFALPAEFFGGKLLAEWACVAGAASSLGLLNAYMATSARNVQAMARKGMLPAVLRGERGAEATPAPALVFSALCILSMTPFEFAQLVEVNMAIYSLTLMLEQIALLRLRWIEPELHRPFRIPLERHWLVLAFLPQMMLCALIIAFSLRTPSGVLLWVVIITSGLGLPRLMRTCGGLEPPRAPHQEKPSSPKNRWRR
jgi:amino acid transporter